MALNKVESWREDDVQNEKHDAGVDGIAGERMLRILENSTRVRKALWSGGYWYVLKVEKEEKTYPKRGVLREEWSDGLALAEHLVDKASGKTRPEEHG